MLPRLLVVLGLTSPFCGYGAPPTETPVTKSMPALEPELGAIRARTGVPALGAAIIGADGSIRGAVVGVRKAGTEVPATLDDAWHLGSDTKAMTATLIGTLIDDGKLTLTTTLAELFPDLAPGFPEPVRGITVAQLLAHRSGLPSSAKWAAFSSAGTVQEQRRQAVRAVATAKREFAPGERYSYSNWGYVILGAIVEKLTGEPWEEALSKRVLQPLGMTHVGFGGLGTPGEVDQPWPHVHGKPLRANGPSVDNPPVMYPAGGVHCPLGDWAKFVANELRGLRGERTLLKSDTFQRLHTPDFGGNYAGGWLVATRAWAKGEVRTHSGSNTYNFCTAWLAPQLGVAYLSVTNDGNGAQACDEAIRLLAKTP